MALFKNLGSTVLRISVIKLFPASLFSIDPSVYLPFEFLIILNCNIVSDPVFFLSLAEDSVSISVDCDRFKLARRTFMALFNIDTFSKFSPFHHFQRYGENSIYSEIMQVE